MGEDLRRMARKNRQISIQLELLANRALAQTGITAVQADVLLFILNLAEEGTSLTDIHQAFGYSMAAISSLLKRLREKGYVRVEHCREDDRRKLLFGAEKGEQVREFLDCAICTAQEQLCCGFSPEELNVLEQMQQKMLGNLSQLMEKHRT